MSKVFDVLILNNVVESANTTAESVLDQIDLLNDTDINTATKIITQIMAVLQDLYSLTGFQESFQPSKVENVMISIKETVERRPSNVYEALKSLHGFNLVLILLQNDKQLKIKDKTKIRYALEQRLGRTKPQQTTGALISSMYSSIRTNIVNISKQNLGFQTEFVFNVISQAATTEGAVLCFEHLQQAERKAKAVSGAKPAETISRTKAQDFNNLVEGLNAEFIAASYYIKLLANGQQKAAKASPS